MRRLVLLCLLLLIPRPASAAWAYISTCHTAIGSVGGTSVTTGSLNCSGANVIIVHVSTGGVAISGAPTDSNSDSFSDMQTSSGTTIVATDFCATTSGGGAMTFSFSQSSAFPGIAVQGFSGGTCTVDKSGTTDNGGLTSSVSITSATPAVANDLAVSMVAYGASETISTSSTGWTLTDQRDYAQDGGNFGLAAGYHIKADSLAESVTWTGTSTHALVTNIVLLEPGGGGGGGGSTQAPCIRSFGLMGKCLAH